MTADEVMRLRREGFDERPAKGSHRVFRKAERRVVVSAHKGDVPIGTLRRIAQQAGWEWPVSR